MSSCVNEKTGLASSKKQHHQVEVEAKYHFLQLILCQGLTIRESAERSKINFATAKKILCKFRKVGDLQSFCPEMNDQIKLLSQISRIQQSIKEEKQKKVKEKNILLIQKLSKFSKREGEESQETFQASQKTQELEIILEKEKQNQWTLLVKVIEAQILKMREN